MLLVIQVVMGVFSAGCNCVGWVGVNIKRILVTAKVTKTCGSQFGDPKGRAGEGWGGQRIKNQIYFGLSWKVVGLNPGAGKDSYLNICDEDYSITLVRCIFCLMSQIKSCLQDFL